MKKIEFVILILAFFASVKVYGQGGVTYMTTKNPSDNSFVLIGGGIDFYSNARDAKHFTGSAAPQIDMALGEWLTPVWGGRIGFTYGNVASYARNGLKVSSPFYYEGVFKGKNLKEGSFIDLHADLLCNWQNLIEVKPQRLYTIYPYVRIGWMIPYGLQTAKPVRVKSANLMDSFECGFGFMNEFRLDDRFSLYADLRAVLPNTNDKVTACDELVFSSMYSVSLGMKYNIGRTSWIPVDDPYYRAERKSGGDRYVEGVAINRMFYDNSFVSATGGVNLGRGPYFNGSCEGGWDVSIGKWFGPWLGGRAGWLGGKIGNNYNMNYYHGDLLFNINNMVRINNDRIWTAMPYIHCGLAKHTMKRQPVNVGFGLLQSVRIWKKLDFLVDARYTDYGRWVREISVSAGLAYNIGRKDWDEVTALCKDKPEVQPKKWSVYTNLADYVDATFNVGCQYALAKHWTADALVQYNTHSYGWKDRYSERKLLSLGARWWPWCVYSGWWIKGAAVIQDYHAAGKLTLAEDPDVPERGDAYGFGVSAGYSLPLTKYFNLEAGVGMLGGWKRFAQYTDTTFATPLAGSETLVKGFCRLGEISLSAVFVF